jgi:predicted aspartyl protease
MRFRVWISILAALACAASLSAAAAADDLPSAAALLEHVRQAAGTPPADVRSVVVGHGTDGEIVETTLRIGDDSRTLTRQGPIVAETGHLTGQDWMRNANGLTVIVEPDPPDTTGETFTDTVERGATPNVLVVDHLTKRGNGTRTFIDATTFAELRTEQISPVETIVTTYVTRARFGTANLPTKWIVTNSRTRASMTYERTEYAIGVVKAADIAMPDSRQVVTFPPGVAQVTLPTLFAGGKIIVHATVMGRPADFYLDSGASTITITPELAKQLGLTTFNHENNAENAGAIDSSQTVVSSIRVGPLEMHDVTVAIVPHIGDQTDVVGLLGFDFLAELGVRIDYERHVVTVVPGETQVPPSDRNVIELDVRLGTLQPVTSARFDGAPADRMIIDTGAAGTFLLFDYFARRHPEVFRQPAPRDVHLYGVGGTFDTDAWTIRHIHLGTMDLQGFTGYRVISKQSYSGDEDGLIGYDLLRHFTVVLDYTNGRVFLTPNHGGADSDSLSE